MAEYFTNIKDRILQIPDNKGIAKEKFFKDLGFSYGNFKGKSKESSPSTDIIAEISTVFPDVNLEWLITGKGEMFKEGEHTDPSKTNIIKLHNDVASIGGRDVSANDNEGNDWEYIDAGGWFPAATSAVRHYGDSMIEYPSGCILVLKQIKDLKDGFILGQNYVIEYGEDYNRVTKRVQRKGKAFMAYSSNENTYADGTLIYQPFELKQIHRAWLVIGCVLKTSSNGVVQVK